METDDIQIVSWNDLSQVLRHKFTLFTGAHRALSDSDLLYLAEKLIVPTNSDNKPITFQRFAKVKSIVFFFIDYFSN